MKLSNFSGKTIAIMVASGFNETAFIAIQRAMMPVLLQGEAISLVDLIEGDADFPKVSNVDKVPVVDRNLVTITAPSEELYELKALNDLMTTDAGESFAA